MLRRRAEATARATLDDAWDRVQKGELQRLAPAAAARLEYMWLTGDEESRSRSRCVDLRLGSSSGAIAGTSAGWRSGCGASAPSRTSPNGRPSPCGTSTEGDWRRAAAFWGEHDHPYDAAEALSLADDDDALLEALAVFDGLGAAASAAHVRRRLRERGVSRRAARGRRRASCRTG